MRKFSLVMVLCLILSMLPVSAFAAASQICYVVNSPPNNVAYNQPTNYDPFLELTSACAHHVSITVLTNSNVALDFCYSSTLQVTCDVVDAHTVFINGDTNGVSATHITIVFRGIVQGTGQFAFDTSVHNIINFNVNAPEHYNFLPIYN